MRWLAFAVVVACGGPDATVPAKTTQRAPGSTAASGVVHAPHGSVIEQVAVTDQGDAALTADADGALRLWPSFDGKHEPVVIVASAASQLALARQGDGFLIALLDRAGGIVLRRHRGDGALIDQVALPPEPGFDEVRLVGTTLLALGRDQRITRYDASGQATGSLAAPPAEEIFAIAVRGDHAVAALARRGESHPDTVRTIATSGALAWGAPMRLPEPVSSISISPNGKRLAGVGAETTFVLLAELTPKLVVKSRGTINARTGDPFDAPREADDIPRTGFLDDDRVAVMPAGTIASFTNPKELQALPLNTIGVTGNGVVASSDGGSLALMMRAPQAQYLGYRHYGVQNEIAPAGKDVAFVSDQHVIQLDARLRRVRTTRMANMFQNHLIPIDERRAVYAVKHDAGYRFELIDLDTGATAKRGLGTFLNNAYPSYEASSRVVAIKDAVLTYRYAIDPATLGVTPLRSLKTPTWGVFTLLDPAQAGRAVAVTVEPSRTSERWTIATYYDDGKPTEAIDPRTKVEVSGQPLGTDRSGMTYIYDGRQHVTRYQHGKAAGTFDLPISSETPHVEVDPSGVMVARGIRKVIVFAPGGIERWQADLRVEQTELTRDGQTLVVDTLGGLIAFDAHTGAQVAKACAWGFGLSDDPPAEPGAAPSVCAE